MYQARPFERSHQTNTEVVVLLRAKVRRLSVVIELTECNSCLKLVDSNWNPTLGRKISHTPVTKTFKLQIAAK